eukprot:g16371.t1
MLSTWIRFLLSDLFEENAKPYLSSDLSQYERFGGAGVQGGGGVLGPAGGAPIDGGGYNQWLNTQLDHEPRIIEPQSDELPPTSLHPRTSTGYFARNFQNHHFITYAIVDVVIGAVCGQLPRSEVETICIMILIITIISAPGTWSTVVNSPLVLEGRNSSCERNHKNGRRATSPYRIIQTMTTMMIR